MRLLSFVTWLGLMLGSGATVLGLLAPWFPPLELINHFRPFFLAGALLLLALAAGSGSRRLIGGAALLFAAHLALASLPFLLRAAPAPDGRTPLKVVTLNLWVGNPDVAAVARFLDRERADVVVLQEASVLQAALIARVKKTYPHAYCPDSACSLALLTRSPPLEVGKEDALSRRPLLLWAKVLHDGRPVTVMGLHLAFPFRPNLQADHVQWLIAYLKQRPGPTVVAGDFNLTPFSWKLLKILRETGLRIHVVDRFTWPAHRLAPVVLLDNVLATPDLAQVAARVGPAVGSDHRPVIAELAWR